MTRGVCTRPHSLYCTEMPRIPHPPFSFSREKFWERLPSSRFSGIFNFLWPSRTSSVASVILLLLCRSRTIGRPGSLVSDRLSPTPFAPAFASHRPEIVSTHSLLQSISRLSPSLSQVCEYIGAFETPSLLSPCFLFARLTSFGFLSLSPSFPQASNPNTFFCRKRNCGPVVPLLVLLTAFSLQFMASALSRAESLRESRSC